MTLLTRRPHAQCLLAQTPAHRAQVYRLRYASYRRKGSIEARPDEQFSDAFDEAPNHFSFLVSDAAHDAIATVRISVVRPDRGWTDAPVLHVYGGDSNIQPLARESFVEASRLCFAPQARRDAFVRLVAHMAAVAEFYDVAWLIACPRVEHASVYQRIFSFTPLAEPRQYFGVKFQAQLLGIRTADLRAFVRDRKVFAGAWSDALHHLLGWRSLVPAAI